MIKNIEIINNGYVTKKDNNTLYFENGESIDFGDVVFVNCVQCGCPNKPTVPIFQKIKLFYNLLLCANLVLALLLLRKLKH